MSIIAYSKSAVCLQYEYVITTDLAQGQAGVELEAPGARGA